MSSNKNIITMRKVGRKANADVEVMEITDVSDRLATKQYVTTAISDIVLPSSPEILKATVTLQPEDIRSLHTGTGFTLVPGVPDRVIMPLYLRFYVPLQSPQYSCEGVFLFVDYIGNFIHGRESEWRIPADGTPTGLLTTNFTSMSMVSMNNASCMAVSANNALVLNSTAAITSGSAPVTIEVSYQLWSGFTPMTPA